jgi:hypothetical protein
MDDEFLLSQLPMINSPELLVKILQSPNDFPFEEQIKASHDKVVYNIKIEEGIEKSISKLKESFNEKEIIKKLKQDIRENQRMSMGYGQVVRWIQENTTTVPTPMSWELKKEQIVNNLYEWLCFFDSSYFWDKPRYSQVIFYKKTI